MTIAAPVSSEKPELLERLAHLSRGHALEGLSQRLFELSELARSDLARIEAAMPDVRPGPRAVHSSARHLLGAGGKRLRPLCVALASRLGGGFDHRALDLGIAAELVHAATLLHDDVVDLGERRRGAPAARVLFGNAVSVFAGDYLLVEALRRVERAAVPGLFAELFDVLESMIEAESLQLERRGSLETSAAEWFAIVEGKTAALFRWAMIAGARVGGLGRDAELQLERYGRHLGVAFQAVDDLLDLTGDPSATGKALFADLHEGKLTYPLILSLEREPTLARELRALATPEGASSAGAAERVRAILRATGSLDDCRDLAATHVALAKEALSTLPPSEARRALETVADATLHRPS